MNKIILYTAILFLIIRPVFAQETLKMSAPPSIWSHKKGGLLTGPVVDLLNIIFSDLEVKIELANLPWARAISHMKSGKLDMIPVIFYTDERAKFMDFSLPYTSVPASVFVPKGKTFTFTGLNDLKGLRGVMVNGDSISTEFKAFEPNLNLSKVAFYNQVLKMIADNRADYAVAAQYGFLMEARKSGYLNKIEMLSKPISSRELHLAFSKKSPFIKYLPAINKKLQQLKKNGTIKKIVNQTIRLNNCNN